VAYRKLISLYEKRLRRFTHAVMPPSLRAALTGSLFRLTHHPDLGFRHVRQLLAQGQGRRALDLYAHENAQMTALADPLFAASLVPQGRCTLNAEFGYRGLWLGGRVSAEWIDIRLDGVAVRREKLRGAGSFRYIIGREALALFPHTGLLDVIDDTGHVLAAWQVGVPHGKGGVAQAIAHRGPLEKKGGLRADVNELKARQDAYLALYTRVNAAFQDEFGKPVFILYGTLLGQHRSADFIPGDDDFDVGYLSEQTSFASVRNEAITLIERLVARGFTVSLNAEGKPFRIRDDQAGPDIWLDNRPVFCPGDNHVWLHKQARLDLPLNNFAALERAELRGCPILKPRDTEAFLAAYYGTGWRVPDPTFSNATKGIDPQITRGLAQVNLTLAQQKELAVRIKSQQTTGHFAPLALAKLYPLDTPQD
jgi:hypothetical protein